MRHLKLDRVSRENLKHTYSRIKSGSWGRYRRWTVVTKQNIYLRQCKWTNNTWRHVSENFKEFNWSDFASLIHILIILTKIWKVWKDCHNMYIEYRIISISSFMLVRLLDYYIRSKVEKIVIYWREMKTYRYNITWRMVLPFMSFH